MRKLILSSLLILTFLNRCVSGITNVEIIPQYYESLESFYEVIDQDNQMIKLDFTLNPGETPYGQRTIYTQVDSDRIYSYSYQLQHTGLSYRLYMGISREESRTSGYRLFAGEHIDEELVYEGLTIRTRLTLPVNPNEVLVFHTEFYFEIDGIGYYGFIIQSNEISENFDKQVVLDYIMNLYTESQIE